MRTLIEGCLSAFALCRDPKKQAKLYGNFLAVLDYRLACGEERHLGSPFVKDTPEKRVKIARKKENARKVLETVGLDYLTGTPSVERLRTALSTGHHKAFRDKWYEDSPRALLKEERMEWLHDVLYVRLCSAVHSDSAASMVFTNLDRGTVFTLCWQLYSAAVYRLVESFRINISAEHKGILRKSYTALQHKP